jgi:outer membrane protein W
MNRMTQAVSGLMIFSIFAAVHGAAAAAEGRWQLKLSGVAAQSTSGGSPDSSFGTGLGLEYRASPRVSVELAAMTSVLGSRQEFDVFEERIVFEESVRTTPVLARLNLHLTPGRRADVYAGPVFGLMRYGDFELKVRGGFPVSDTAHLPTKDGYAWGAHLGIDLPLGDHGLFFTGGATYLKAKLKLDVSGLDEEGGDTSTDLDPLFVQAGLGYRF